MLTMARINRPRNKNEYRFIYVRKAKSENTVLSIVHVEIDRAGATDTIKLISLWDWEIIEFAVRVCCRVSWLNLPMWNTKPTFPLNQYVSLPDKRRNEPLAASFKFSRLRQEQWRIKRTVSYPKTKQKENTILI